MSGLSISYIEKCDGRNEKLIDKLPELEGEAIGKR